jgi:hypothetical protein
MAKQRKGVTKAKARVVRAALGSLVPSFVGSVGGARTRQQPGPPATVLPKGKRGADDA